MRVSTFNYIPRKNVMNSSIDLITYNIMLLITLQEPIISGLFLTELKRIVKDDGNPAAQLHAAGTIRNLAAGEQTEVRLTLRWALTG